VLASAELESDVDRQLSTLAGPRCAYLEPARAEAGEVRVDPRAR
jgi:hypothetical protein